MRRLVIVLGAALLTACPSPEALCKAGVDQVCEREFECQPQQVKDSTQFQAAFGTSVADCKTGLYANPLRPAGAQGLACADVKTDAQLCGNLGQTSATSFDLSKAADCKDARAKLSCADYLAQVGAGGATPPAPCQERCK